MPTTDSTELAKHCRLSSLTLVAVSTVVLASVLSSRETSLPALEELQDAMKIRSVLTTERQDLAVSFGLNDTLAWTTLSPFGSRDEIRLVLPPAQRWAVKQYEDATLESFAIEWDLYKRGWENRENLELYALKDGFIDPGVGGLLVAAKPDNYTAHWIVDGDTTQAELVLATASMGGEAPVAELHDPEPFAPRDHYYERRGGSEARLSVFKDGILWPRLLRGNVRVSGQSATIEFRPVWAAIVEVDVQQTLREAAETSVPNGTFQKSFPNLFSWTLNTAITIPLDSLQRRLAADLAAATAPVKVGPLSLKGSQLYIWGAIILVSLYCYYLISLHELQLRLSSQDKGWNYPFAALYESRLGWLALLLATTVLPALAGLALVAPTDFLPTDGFASWFTRFLGILCILPLPVLTSLLMYKLHRKRAGLSVDERYS